MLENRRQGTDIRIKQRWVKKEGYVQISEILSRTAEQERAHAKNLLKFLEGGEVEIAASYPVTPPGTTVENLQNAASGEEHEYETMYPEFAAIAEGEGFPLVAATMRSIAVAEKSTQGFIDALLQTLRRVQCLRGM